LKALAGFAMQGRLRAALVVAVFALLAVVVPPVVIISGAALALVTLRRGPLEGLLIGAIALAGGGALAALAMGAPSLILGYVLALWLPVWALATLLRATVSLSVTLTALAAVVVVGLLITFVALGDPAIWWQRILGELVPLILQDMGAEVSDEVIQRQIAAIAPSVTGLVASQLAALNLMSLLLGRWLQAQLYNPGGFGQEFRELRMGRPLAVVTLVIFIGAPLSKVPAMLNLALGLSIALGMFGLAVVHSAAKRSRAGRGWLIAMYVGMGFVMYPVFTVLAILGASDHWLNLRDRIARGRGPAE
jgi:hypothetical protein